MIYTQQNRRDPNEHAPISHHDLSRTTPQPTALGRNPKERQRGQLASAPRQTNPIWEAEGRHCGLRIADWGFEEARCAGLVWTARQTNPISAFLS
jgi:hypothetical protein